MSSKTKTTNVIDVKPSDVYRLRKLCDQDIAEEPDLCMEDPQELHDFGVKDGSKWAAKMAEPNQLELIENTIRLVASDNDNWLSFKPENYSLEETLVSCIIMPFSNDPRYETRDLELFWRPFGREYSIVRSFEYLDGFLHGAIDTWKTVKAHPYWADDESN